MMYVLFTFLRCEAARGAGGPRGARGPRADLGQAEFVALGLPGYIRRR